MAVNCSVPPTVKATDVGVTAIAVTTSAFTVSAAVPLTEPEVAVTVTDPAVTPVARPLAVMVAVDADDVLHVTATVPVEPSLYVPVAVNCWLAPVLTLAVAGVTEIDCSVFVTVTVSTSRLALPVMPLSEAVTLVDPEATAVSKPLALIVAIDELPTDQVTVELTLAVEPSLYFAVAVNCCVAPIKMLAVAGDTVTAVNVFVGGGVVVELGTPAQPMLAITRASETGARRQTNRFRRVRCMDLLLLR